MFFNSSNQSYKFYPEYFNRLNHIRSLHSIAQLPLYESHNLFTYSQKYNDISFMQYIGKVYEAILILNVLENIGKLRTFDRSLDIGSGPALQIRFMKMAGIIKYSEAIDLYNGTSRCSEATFSRYALQHLALNNFYRFQSILPKGLILASNTLSKFRYKYPYGFEEFSFKALNLFSNYNPYRSAIVDRFTVGDVYSIEGQYELITSFMALDYFEFNLIAKKVSSLLAPGGIFAFIVSYWWYPINNTLLYGNFPYLLQQLTFEDVLRYYEENHPFVSIDGVKKRLGYSDQRRLSIIDYENIAYSNNLKPLTSVRLRPLNDSNARSIIGPSEIDKNYSNGLSEIVNNINRWKPGISSADLMTSHVLLVFEKCR